MHRREQRAFLAQQRDGRTIGVQAGQLAGHGDDAASELGAGRRAPPRRHEPGERGLVEQRGEARGGVLALLGPDDGEHLDIGGRLQQGQQNGLADEAGGPCQQDPARGGGRWGRHGARSLPAVGAAFQLPNDHSVTAP